MSDIEFYEVVEVLNSPAAVTLGVSGRRGIVLGVSEGANGKVYAVSVDDLIYMLNASDLSRTGERVTRESIYDGNVIKVPPRRYSAGDQECSPGS